MCSQRKVNASCRNNSGMCCKVCCLSLGGCSASGHSLEPSLDVPHPSNSQNSLPHFTFQMPVPRHDQPMPSTQPKRHSQSSRTGHLNVITNDDMIQIVPRPRIAPELALIDRTLEELEGDEPDWDIPWHHLNSATQSHSSVSVSPVKKRARVMTPSSSRSPQSSPRSAMTLPLLRWPSGRTVADVSNAFKQIFEDDGPSLSPRQRFETYSGEEWNPDVFFLHYDLWKAMSEEDLKAGKSSDWVSYVQSCDFAL